jgi:hypothetical protein
MVDGIRLDGLRERGLEVTRPLLVVIDGAKALRRARPDRRCCHTDQGGCRLSKH